MDISTKDKIVDILLELNGIVTCCVEGQENKNEAYEYLDAIEELLGVA